MRHQAFKHQPSPSLPLPVRRALRKLGQDIREARRTALRQHGAQPGGDRRELRRRIVFTILISNVDDHMRNHGFLFIGNAGWALSPAYALNPVPVDVKPRILSIAIDDEDQTASLALVLSVAEYCDLDKVNAQRIAGVVGRTVSQWRTEAARPGISKAECTRMESTFAHADLEMALGFA